MKSFFKNSVIVILLFGTTIYFTSCKKEAEEPIKPITLAVFTIISSISETSATVEGALNGIGGTYITEEGVCWSTSPNPTISSNKISNGTVSSFFNIRITWLTSNSKYYVRAYATYSLETIYGNEISFTTDRIIAGPTGPIFFNPDLTYGSVLDIDGNNYKTIQIGAQRWMAENLKTTKFNDGILIPDITDSIEWQNLSTPGYCWYNNNEATYKGTYGALYNWYAVKTDKLCPTGWHAPSNDEWNTLITYLGGEVAAGGKVIETGNTHWLRTIAGASNETGFTGLPGGSRSISDDFRGFGFLGYFGHWWTTTDYTPPYDALVTQLPSMNDITGQWDFEAGFAAKKFGGASVRCVKN